MTDLLSAEQLARIDQAAHAWPTVGVDTDGIAAIVSCYQGSDEEGLPLGDALEVWRISPGGHVLPRVCLTSAGRRHLREQGIAAPDGPTFTEVG